MNLAAIDIGTNSFHLIVVKIGDDGNFEIIDREKVFVRLGRDTKGSEIKFISDELMENSIQTLKTFKGIADSYNAELKAVATSAVREAENKQEFINRIREATGILIEVISGNEEARLIYLGVLKSVPVYEKKSLIIDIGGGSTEFLVGMHGKHDYAVSLKLGAVRLSNKFFPDYLTTKNSLEDCKEWIKGEIIHAVREVKNQGFEVAVGASGTVTATAAIINFMKNRVNNIYNFNNFLIKKKDLEKVVRIASKLNKPEDRRKEFGLDPKRAEILPAGLSILHTIFTEFELDEMLVSDYALREGIILDYIENVKDKNHLKITNIRRESVKKLSETYNYSREHCSHVQTLALSVFDQLSNYNLISPELREFIEYSSLLHDIGYHISHQQHHKHSYYIIRHSELLGFNEREIQIIANVARYHRKSNPKISHLEFSMLDEIDRNIVRKLAGILRIADSFDRTHKKNIETIKIEVTDSVILFRVYFTYDFPEIEIWNIERRKSLFEEEFGRSIEITAFKK